MAFKSTGFTKFSKIVIGTVQMYNASYSCWFFYVRSDFVLRQPRLGQPLEAAASQGVLKRQRPLKAS